MNAIGSGIGTSAAHEIGHQFLGLSDGMEDSSTNTYNSVECKGWDAPWVYGVGAIQWEAITAGALKSALGTGWHRQ